MKRNLIVTLVVVLILWGGGIFAGHMYDGMVKQTYQAPWHIVDWYMFWGPFASTDTLYADTCGGCDSAEASTRIVDTAYTVWMPQPINADGYLIHFQIIHQDSMFGVDSTETLSVGLQTTSNHTDATPTVNTIKADAFADVEDLTLRRYYAHPDSFIVGPSQWIWGTHTRCRIIRTIWPDTAACLVGCYTPDTTLYDHTKVRIWIKSVDTY